jgi:hypothetical protein
MSSRHRPIEAEMGRMVKTKGLSMKVVSILIQEPPNSLDPVVQDMLQFRLLNLVQMRLNAIKKIHWPRDLLSC